MVLSTLNEALRLEFFNILVMNVVFRVTYVNLAHFVSVFVFISFCFLYQL
jgi:hypothetical protein